MSLLDRKSRQHTNPLVSDSVMDILNQYMQGTEHSDITVLEKTFHKDFRVVAITPEGLRIINRADYLTLIKEHKIGGQKRTLTLKNAYENENVMQVSLTLQSKKAIFHDHLNLIKGDEGWRILHNSTQMKILD